MRFRSWPLLDCYTGFASEIHGCARVAATGGKAVPNLELVRRREIEAVAIPLPIPEMTPPEIKIYFIRS